MKKLLTLLLLFVPLSAAAELQISNAWIKNLPPAMPMRAGYMSIHNPQDRVVTLVGASSERFGKVEFHQSIAEDGVMRMEMLHHLTLEPGETIELAPGGMHLMMMKPVAATKPGETITIKLQFEDGAEQELDMQVKK